MRSSLPRVIPLPLEKMELLDYSKGIDSFEANDIVAENNLRVANDSRISTHGRYSTRKGTDFYSVPAGETLSTQQTSVTGASDASVTLTTWFGAKFAAGATGRLTKVALNFKNTASGTGPIIVQIQSDSGGSPSGTVLASSSIPAATPTGSYAYIDVRFIEAPQITSGTSYWIVCYIQDDGTNNYKWSSTTNATTAKTSTDSGVTWSTTTYDLNYKTYYSTDSATLGMYRAYKADGTKKTLLAHGTTLYSITDASGALSTVKSGLTANGKYYFETANDIVYYVNNQDAPRKWDFTTDSSNPGTTTVSSNIILHKDQIFYMDKTAPNRVFFTDKTAFETFTSTNFFYVPSPKSADNMTAWGILNDNLFIFTRRTKWALTGSDLSSFVLRRSTGLKGTYTQDSVQFTRNYCFFVADDGIYRFNGATDELISKQVADEFNAITNKAGITTALANNRFYVFYSPPGSSVNSKCLVYNINYGSWESIDQNTYVNLSNVWNNSNDSSELILASNVVGAAYYAEASSNTYNNLGKQLQFELRTKYEFFENPASKKRVKRWYPRFAASSGAFNVSCQYDKDFINSPTSVPVALGSSGTTWGSGALWGSFTWGASATISPRISIPGRAKYIQFRIKRTGVNNAVDFYGHTLLFMTQRPR